MCERKAFPKPCPSEAPFTKPAISTTLRNAGTLLQETNKTLVISSFQFYANSTKKRRDQVNIYPRLI